MEWFKHLVRLLGRALQDDYHEAPHQKGAIYHLVWLFTRAEVEDPIILVGLIAQQSRQFPGVAVDHGQVERPKVLVERHISQVVIDIEEERIFIVLWGLVVSDPIELIYRKLKVNNLRESRIDQFL